MKGKSYKVRIPGMSPTDEGDPEGSFCLVIEGQEASGKDELAFRTPGPHAIFAIDAGARRAILRAREAGKEVHVHEIPFDLPRFVPKQEKEFWVQRAEKVKSEVFLPYTQAWDAAVGSEVRTMIQDTATDIYEMHQAAEFGKLQQNSQLAYGPIKAEYMAMVRRAKRAGKIVVLIHQLGEEYKDTIDAQGNKKSERTGKLLRKGMNKVQYIADAIVRTKYRDPVTAAVPGGGRKVTKPGQWEVELILVKNAREFDGMVLTDPSFQELMAYLDPNTDPSFWE
jgi:hypothetical protein